MNDWEATEQWENNVGYLSIKDSMEIVCFS